MANEQILIVEDDGIIAFRFQELLSGWGYRTVTVASGEEAVKQAPQLQPDLILMDIRLGGSVDGTEAAAQIRACVDVPVVFLTAFADEKLMSQANKSAPYGYLVKPVQDRELQATIATALYRHRLDLAIKESEARFRTLFEHSPYAIWEEDLSDLKANFDRLRAQDVTDLRSYFQMHPTELARCALLIKVRDVNQENLAFFQVPRKEDVLSRITRFFTEDSWPVFREELVSLAEGRATFDCEMPMCNSRGEPKTVFRRCTVVPGYETTLARVLVSFMDITTRKEAEAEREKLIAELQAALAQVKTLSGLLPICASCKKIRDDQGYWSSVESYIQQHTEVRFSHGLCPECMKKFYPDLGL